MPLQLVMSQKNQRLLSLNGYLFSRKSVNKTSILWRCIFYFTDVACKCSVHTDSEKRTGKVIGGLPDHEHPADLSFVEAKKVQNKIRKRGRKYDDPPGLVVGKVVVDVLLPVAACLLKMVSMVRSVKRQSVQA